MYAIIDIETTGGNSIKNRITEIAIIIHDGEKEQMRFQSLINPCQNIPYKITQLTGINDQMVSEAPLFVELAKRIDEITKDCVFVAHNVNFDYPFVKEEFARIGLPFRRKKLCTVRLSRKLLPNRRSYSLGRLCESEGILIHDRHRAMGDAGATAILFQRLLAEDKNNFIAHSLNPLSLESLLPPNIPKKDYESLPESQGIYYFLNQKKKIVYIGKAKNIKSRVHTHFGGNSNTKGKYYFVKNVFGVDFKLVSSQLVLDITEAIEIKKHWPIYNKSLKRFSLNFGLFRYYDRNGYLRLSQGKCGKFDRPIKSFRNGEKLKFFLKEVVKEFKLCPRLAGLQPIGSGKCNYIEGLSCNGACLGDESTDSYNQRVEHAIESRVDQASNYIIREKESEESQAIALVEKGKFIGIATGLPLAFNLSNLSAIKEEIQSVYDDQDMSYLLSVHRQRANEEDIILLK